MSIEHGDQTFQYTEVSLPDRVETIRSAATEFLGTMTVRVLDPSITSEADLFANAVWRNEDKESNRSQDVNLDYDGYGGIRTSYVTRTPRTLDQIRKDVIEPAKKSGKMLVVVTDHQTGGQGLSPFWRRVSETEAFDKD